MRSREPFWSNLASGSGQSGLFAEPPTNDWYLRDLAVGRQASNGRNPPLLRIDPTGHRESEGFAFESDAKSDSIAVESHCATDDERGPFAANAVPGGSEAEQTVLVAGPTSLFLTGCKGHRETQFEARQRHPRPQCAKCATLAPASAAPHRRPLLAGRVVGSGQSSCPLRVCGFLAAPCRGISPNRPVGIDRGYRAAGPGGCPTSGHRPT